MKEIGIASWKLTQRESLADIFTKFSLSENNHVYSITKLIPW